jgi:arginyl-tRNA synthetase
MLVAHDPEWEALWQETRRWSLDEMAEIFDDLGVEIDRQYLESEVVARGQAMVDYLIEKGIAKESQGAIVVDLEEVKLGVFLVRKSDGTSLYATKDLALAEKKAAEYPSALRSLILVDNRQSFYFKQLFETLKRMGIKTPHEFIGNGNLNMSQTDAQTELDTLTALKSAWENPSMDATGWTTQKGAKLLSQNLEDPITNVNEIMQNLTRSETRTTDE